jgi:hypothetical protein
MTIFDPMLWVIALRSLLQHRVRTTLLGGGRRRRHRPARLARRHLRRHEDDAARFGHHADERARQRRRLLQVDRELSRRQSSPTTRGCSRSCSADVPDLDYVVQRGRGWAKLVSPTPARCRSASAASTSLNEPGFREGRAAERRLARGLKNREDGLLLFEEQARKLDVKVGDKLTFAAPTFQAAPTTRST